MPQTTTTAPQAAAPVDPYRAYNFKLEIQGVTAGHFTEVSGFDISVQAIPYREAGVSQVVRQIPGQVEYGAITLRYGLTSSSELWEWFMNSVRGKVERRNVSIVMVGSDGVAEVMRYNLNNAWPSRWRGAALDALGREMAIESLTLAFDTLERA